MIYFIHIPKCGGSTVRNYIRTALSDSRALADQRQTIYVYGAQGKMGDFNISSDDLPNFGSTLSPAYTKAIIGHYNYRQLSLYLNHENTYPSTFSIVREPIARFISNINYIKLNPTHPGHGFMRAITSDNLFDYLKDAGSRGAGSYQIRTLSLVEADNKEPISDYRKVVAEIKKRVRVFKVENSLNALHSSVCFIDDGHLLKKANVTGRSEVSKSLRKPDFLSISNLSKHQFEEVQGLFKEDTYLYHSAD